MIECTFSAQNCLVIISPTIVYLWVGAFASEMEISTKCWVVERYASGKSQVVLEVNKTLEKDLESFVKLSKPISKSRIVARLFHCSGRSGMVKVIYIG
jgi:hypothetical protein